MDPRGLVERSTIRPHQRPASILIHKIIGEQPKLNQRLNGSRCKLSGVAEKCLVVGREVPAGFWRMRHRLHTKLRSTATISGVLIRQQLFYLRTPPALTLSLALLFIFIRNKLIRAKTQRDFLRGSEPLHLFIYLQGTSSAAIYLIRENSTFQNRGSVVELIWRLVRE